MSFTNASDARSGCRRRGGANSCSRSTSRSARRSPTRVRPTAVLELADGRQARRKLYQELESGPQLGNALACAQDYLEAVRAAIAARNGWKRILHACAPPGARPTRPQD
jgi:hypothetical protein